MILSFRAVCGCINSIHKLSFATTGTAGGSSRNAHSKCSAPLTTPAISSFSPYLIVQLVLPGAYLCRERNFDLMRSETCFVDKSVALFL